MTNQRLRIVLIGAAIGVALGVIAGWLAADAQQQRTTLASAGATTRQPRLRNWVGFGVAAVTLVRQFGDLMSPD